MKMFDERMDKQEEERRQYFLSKQRKAMDTDKLIQKMLKLRTMEEEEEELRSVFLIVLSVGMM